MAAGLALNAPSKVLRSLARDLEKAERDLQKARVRALNRSLVPIRKEAILILKKDYNITKTKPVRDAMTLRRARRGSVEAAVEVGRDQNVIRIPLVAFGARQVKEKKKRAGVSVQIFRTGQRRILKPAFFAYKRKGVFVRKRGVARFPIMQLFGPPITSVFLYNLPEIAERGGEILAVNLDRQISFIFGR